MEPFHFTLSTVEKNALKHLVREAIAAKLNAQACWTPPQPPTERLKEPFGAFVCLSIAGGLRGCIGHIMADKPLWETIGCMAVSAAFEDPRFPPLSKSEFDEVEVEISILGPVAPCPDPELVEVGRHGLIMVQGHRQGLLLPQVPVDWNWDKYTFLAQTCRKAGLAPDAWRSPDTHIYWFEAEVF
ncbi:MAG: AmmeMemoRadiSam system protein A [Acidobacteriota bacterium]